MNLFEKIFEVTRNVEDLDVFVRDNIQEISNFNNSQHKSVKTHQESIERFIILKIGVIEQLNFDNTYNRAFVSLLIDLSERLFIDVTRLANIAVVKNIAIGSRLEAALLFLCNIDCNSRYIERFESICNKIEAAINEEEDDASKPIATFINYYSYVVRNTFPHKRFTDELIALIISKSEGCQYRFIQDPRIVEAIGISRSDENNAFNQLQQIVDDLLGKSGEVKPFVEVSYLIENGSNYAHILSTTENNFKKIRQISVSKCQEMQNRDDIYYSLNRGVAIIEDETQLFSYMNSYANAHYAKLMTALTPINFEEIEGKVEIFDWSCGQALATMVFFEYLKGKTLNFSINNITLIEPSEPALKRAALHTKHFNSKCNVKTICKDLDSLSELDIMSSSTNSKIHFFSNILDVEAFALDSLINKISNTQKGWNYFICVSPFINDVKSERLEYFTRHFAVNENYRQIFSKTTRGNLNDDYWCCNNKFNDRLGLYCNHTAKGCSKKWTRIVRVFKVLIE